MRLSALAKFLGILICIQAPPSYAQVVNQTSVYENVFSCAAYQDYLDESEVVSGAITDCDSRTVFLVESSGKGISNFLRDYLHRSEQFSPMHSLVEMLQADVRSYLIAQENVRAYFLAEEARLQIYSSFMQVGDEERAALYSTLIYRVKKRLLLQDLIIDSPISNELLAGDVLVADILGGKFGSLDSVRPTIALICLLRVDNFRVDVSEELLSARMNSCLSKGQS